MSNDLVKRMDTIENIWSLFNNTYNDASRFDAEETEIAKRILSDVQMVLEKQPTAYDVNKVVEQLEERMCGAEDEATDVGCYMRNLHFREAIEIVKSGGIE